ncbi:MAG: hypothetical protein ACTSX8_01625 [Alphaproteobacteria bacterium]
MTGTPQAKPKAVTLIGMGATSSAGETVGEVWGLNNGYRKFPEVPWTRYFATHATEFERGYREPPPHDQPGHLTQLAMLGCPIYMELPIPEVPQSVAYPTLQVVDKLGHAFLWGGCPCLMLGLAIAEGFQHIRTYGFDQMDDGHVWQRGNWAYLMGQARGLGIVVDGTAQFSVPPTHNGPWYEGGYVGFLERARARAQAEATKQQQQPQQQEQANG